VIGETVAMVGHDLRNPLQTIASALYILDQKFELTADQDTKEMLDIIRSGLDYADNIVKELLDYSREIRLELAETSIKKLTQEALQRLKIPEKITVMELTQDQPNISVDPAKTQRVLINLITNAIDAMPNGGDLTITTKKIDNTLEISVADTGGGISEDVMKSLWRPLKTTKSKGMGLGLAICKRIIEAHDGSIDVETTSGRGTTFTIRLPLQSKTTIPPANVL
jgi:signal transduction histidine kinase